MSSDDHEPPIEPPASEAREPSPPGVPVPNGFGAPVEFVDHEPTPAEADEITADRARRWTTSTLLVATVMLLFLNAASLRTWASTLPPDWTTETLRQLAQVWTDRIAIAGFDAPRNAIHEAYEAQKAARWGDGATESYYKPVPPPPGG
jgi:hypothetical protein